MLQDKYLPEYHFSELHTIAIKASPEKIFQNLSAFQFGDSSIVKLLLTLRGMPAKTQGGLEKMQRMGFVLLEVKDNEEVILGLAGQFWRPSGNIQRFRSSKEFLQNDNPHYAKATWNFRLTPNGNSTVVETETRVFCGKHALSKFRLYWFFIRPFSGIIRKAMLKGIKRKTEQNTHV